MAVRETASFALAATTSEAIGDTDTRPGSARTMAPPFEAATAGPRS